MRSQGASDTLLSQVPQPTQKGKEEVACCTLELLHCKSKSGSVLG